MLENHMLIAIDERRKDLRRQADQERLAREVSGQRSIWRSTRQAIGNKLIAAGRVLLLTQS